MAEHERNRRWVPMDSVAPPIIATAPTAPPLNSESDEDDDDYVDAGSSFQQQQHGYVASAIRRSTVPEAAYSQVNVSGCRRSRRPSSVFCGYLTITVAFASILLNIAMSGTALMVIIDVTSPGSDVICTLLRSLWCQADSNCTVPTDHPADHPAHSSALHQTKVNDSFRSPFVDDNNVMTATATGKPVTLQCAAHLFFIYPESSQRTHCIDDKDEFQKLTNWTDGGNHAFIRPCITADSKSGMIAVARGGDYVFYDHLAVCRCAGDAGFRQRVYRRPAKGGAAEKLIEDSSAGGSQGRGEGCVGQPTFSSDLFAVVRLEDGDSVWIDVKPASAVYRPNTASFFGLYKL